MVLDVIDESAGRFHIWGKTDDGRSILCRVQDFAPYFYIAAPVHAVSARRCWYVGPAVQVETNVSPDGSKCDMACTGAESWRPIAV